MGFGVSAVKSVGNAILWWKPLLKTAMNECALSRG